jgi:hypothetical protein
MDNLPALTGMHLEFRQIIQIVDRLAIVHGLDIFGSVDLDNVDGLALAPITLTVPKDSDKGRAVLDGAYDC